MGFVGYGLLHLALAWVAAQIALGRSAEGDQSGAFRTLAEQPFGELLLWFVIACLVALAIWQAVLAIWGHRDTQGKHRIAERVFSAARVIVYLVLAFTAGKVVTGAPQSSAQQQQQATAGLMAKPAGVWLVGLVGLGVLAFGIGMLWYGLKRKFERKLEFGGGRSRSAAIRAGQVGYAAKGVAFGIAGYLLVEAAVKNDPGKSRGLDAALHTVAGQPYGKFLLLAIALGLAAFAVYCVFQVRYRKAGS
ncbi:DUF1206 domain-containing protein [Dactylosporangium sucinum]|uniref:DUF1206 domain-containing protein n=1 Tax=Dactylosporangium sucinum TaxID=1424081 RepID=UPI00167E7CB3|nr:DUF1206 domain-containing protein [Dactylosporangium sucinum]